MNFATLLDGVTVLGFFTLVVGGCVLGSAGLAFIQSIPARLRTQYGGTEAFATGPRFPCEMDDTYEPRCITHNCDAIDQCGKLACPHCMYKFDAEAGAFGYAAPNSDPFNAANYANHTNYNTGEPCPVDCTPEPTFVRVKRVRPQDFFYELGEDGRITDAIELNEDHTAVIAEYHEKPAPDEYAAYEAAVRASADATGSIPHCDSNVLHAPGQCEYCDERPDLQEFRLLHGINFTGQFDPSKLLCPAEAKRDLHIIERWGGNIAKRRETQRFGDHLFIPAAYQQAKDEVEQKALLAHLVEEHTHEDAPNVCD